MDNDIEKQEKTKGNTDEKTWGLKDKTTNGQKKQKKRKANEKKAITTDEWTKRQ